MIGFDCTKQAKVGTCACACALFISSVMLASQAATAGSVGVPFLSAETKAASVDGDAAYAFPGFANSGLMVKQIFVEGLLPGDEVTAVSGDAIAPASIQSSSGIFFNGIEVGQIHGRPSAALFATNPSLQWDTWVVIDNAFVMVGPGFPNIALPGGGSNIIANSNMAWFALPAIPTVTGKVLIGQFAFTEGSAFSMTVNVSVRRSGMVTDHRNLNYSFQPPSDPVGACCIAGACLEDTQANCIKAAGVYFGDGSECGSVQCETPPDPVGACCILGECAEVTQAFCDLMSGEFSGVGSLCSDVNCAGPPDPIGACCVNGECVEVTQANCDLLTGEFSGVGTICGDIQCVTPPDPTGACCIFDACVDVSQDICSVMGGTFFGVGSLCSSVQCQAPPPPTGACCVNDACLELTQAMCATMGGTFFADSQCGDVQCQAPPAPVGACCVGGACQSLSQVQCAAMNGTFMGEGVLCGDTQCQMPPAAGTGGSFAFWKNPTPRDRDYSHWPLQHSPDDLLATVFVIPSCISASDIHGGTLLDALKFGGGAGVDGAAKLMLRSAAAALLNAQMTQNGVCGAAYPLPTTQTVIAIVNQKLATCNRDELFLLMETLNAYNNLNNPLAVHGGCR